MTGIGGHLYMKKMTKGLPPIRKQTLSKKAQEKNNKIKRKLHTDNSNWNDWKLQLHCNKLERVNPIGKIVRKNLFNFFKNLHIEQNDRTAHWVGHSILK